MRLSGTEALSVELGASVLLREPLDVPAPLALERDAAGAARACVLVLLMRGLGVDGAPRFAPRADYGEALYRIGVTLEGEPAWLALLCDLDRAPVRALASKLIRYPVRTAAVDLDERGLEVRPSGGALSVRLSAIAGAAAPVSTPPRRTFVRAPRGGGLLEVPWDERPAPVRRRVAVDVRDASACLDAYRSAPTFDAEAVLHVGRTHMCGLATTIPVVTRP